MIEENLKKVLEKIQTACKDSNRNAEEITLIAVTKTIPKVNIDEAIEAGIEDIGENRVQELESKNLQGATVHLIGHLQTNKVKKAVELADIIHSVDSLKLAKKIEQYSPGHKILIQINTSNEESKFGLVTGDENQIKEILKLNLNVIGLMTIGPHTANETQILESFQLLRKLKEKYKLAHLSMGMSNDFELAIKEGATMIRVGSAIFGARN